MPRVGNQRFWRDTSSALLPSHPLCLLPLPRHVWKVFHCLDSLCASLEIFQKKVNIDGERKGVERLHYRGIGPPSFLLACFVVNDKKKPEGDVPSKHLSDCLEYGFISDHRENIHF